MTDLETLRKLRNTGNCGTKFLDDDGERISREQTKFLKAAHTALGPEGCVTKELERFQEQYAGMRDLAAREQVGCKQFMAERDALKSECALLHQRCEKLEAENKSMLLHTTDAQKENAALLARLVKLSAAAQGALRFVERISTPDNEYDLPELRAVLDEIPPKPSWDPA
jgi:hypothetical protein